MVVAMGTQTDDPAQPAPKTGEGANDQHSATAGSFAGEAPAVEPPPPAGGAFEPPAPVEDLGLEVLLDIPMELTVELGRTKIPIRELLKLSPGSAVKLAKFEGEPVDILANDVLIARGEVVVRNEKYGIRITEITSRADRLRGLR
jgi:flagellar motor switch protein FliN/FliY